MYRAGCFVGHSRDAVSGPNGAVVRPVTRAHGKRGQTRGGGKDTVSGADMR